MLAVFSKVALSRKTVVPPFNKVAPPYVRADSKLSVLPPERTKLTPVPPIPPANVALAPMFVTRVPAFVVLPTEPPALGTAVALPVLSVPTHWVCPCKSKVPPLSASGWFWNTVLSPPFNRRKPPLTVVVPV